MRRRSDRNREANEAPDLTRGPATGTGSSGAGAAALDSPATPQPDSEVGHHRRFAPEDRLPDVELYDVTPKNMPPSPAGGGAETGGEPAASRRLAGLPPELARDPDYRPGEPTPGREPFLGYDGLAMDDILDWIDRADPDPEQLRAIYFYEKEHLHRDPILEECERRLEKLGEPVEG